MSAKADIDRAAEKVAQLQETLAAGFTRIARILAGQQAQIDELQARQEARREAAVQHAAETPNDEEWRPGRPGAPEGKIRFASQSRRYGLWMIPMTKAIVDRQAVINHGRKLDFEDGILDLDADDPAVEFLRQHEAFGVDFVEDPLAERLPGPTVVEGSRGSHSRPSKQTTPAARGELAARL